MMDIPGQSSNPVILEFVKRWHSQIANCELLAQQAENLCSEQLSKTNIRHLTSSRAKSMETIEASIVRREKNRIETQRLGPYADDSEIYRDMIDLAGVRIKLYFPKDIKKVKEVIVNTFDKFFEKEDEDLKNTVIWPAPRKDGETNRFPGYHATHFRCKLKADNMSTRYDFKDKAIEIQVASIVMHAWQEVHHDIIYKPYSGTPSSDEESFLDLINGLAHADEVALELLQHSLLNRINKPLKRFGSLWEFLDYFSKAQDVRVFPDSRSQGIILQIMRVFNYDSPAGLDKLAEPLGKLPHRRRFPGLITSILYKEQPVRVTDPKLQNLILRNAGMLYLRIFYYLDPHILEGFATNYSFGILGGCSFSSGAEETEKGGHVELPGFQLAISLSCRGVFYCRNDFSVAACMPNSSIKWRDLDKRPGSTSPGEAWNHKQDKVLGTLLTSDVSMLAGYLEYMQSQFSNKVDGWGKIDLDKLNMNDYRILPFCKDIPYCIREQSTR